MQKILVNMLAALVVLGAMSLAGCAENAAASAKCKAVRDAEGCSKCCTNHGASGDTFVGSNCTCRGG